MRAPTWQLALSFRHRGVIMAALVLPTVAACAPQYDPVLSDVAVMPAYSIDEVHALADRSVRVEVYGDPFSVATDAFAGQVAANMNQANAAPAHFSAHAGNDARRAYHVVWNFSPPRESLAPNQVCRTTSAPPGAGGTPIDAYAAFCYGGDALTSVRGRLYYTDTQNSVEFLHLVDAMTEQLFPTEVRGPLRSGDSRLGRPNTRISSK